VEGIDRGTFCGNI